jgi:GPH family glycoside/pentoside/hexuronide:cation symporter
VALILFIKRVTGNEALGYTGLVFICTLCMVIGYFIHFKMTESYEKLPEQGPTEQGPVKRKQKASFSDLVQTLVKNPALLVFLAGDFGLQLSGFIGTATIAYVFTYVIENFGLMSVSMTLSAVVTMGAALFTPLVAKKLDSRRIMLLGAFLGAAVTFSRVFFWSEPWVFIVASAAATIPMALTNISKQSIYADLAVLGEYKTGQDVKGFVIGLQTVPLKWASMARTVAITAGLALIGYTAGTTPTAAIKNGLVTLSIVVPAIGMLFCGLIVLFFVRLPKEKVLEMKQEIAKRKAAAS